LAPPLLLPFVLFQPEPPVAAYKGFNMKYITTLMHMAAGMVNNQPHTILFKMDTFKSPDPRKHRSAHPIPGNVEKH
jgi:hypothetical protein